MLTIRGGAQNSERRILVEGAVVGEKRKKEPKGFFPATPSPQKVPQGHAPRKRSSCLAMVKTATSVTPLRSQGGRGVKVIREKNNESSGPVRRRPTKTTSSPCLPNAKVKSEQTSLPDENLQIKTQPKKIQPQTKRQPESEGKNVCMNLLGVIDIILFYHWRQLRETVMWQGEDGEIHDVGT